jgi:16S rRNA (uracil1498-N3)-methyltransferase
LRLFVPPSSLADGRLTLHGAEAERLAARGVRPGQTVVALDDSGWEYTVALDSVSAALCAGAVTGRQLVNERRTKVSLYQGLLHPSDFRRLIVRATELGVVAFIPVIADGSVVPMLDPAGQPEGEEEWPRLARDAAEACGRGRRPTVGQTMLLDHALDEASRQGTVLLPALGGVALDSALAERPFSLALFCPPPGGFTTEEVARARGRGVTVVQPPAPGPDPIQPAVGLLEVLYGRLEGYTAPPVHTG